MFLLLQCIAMGENYKKILLPKMSFLIARQNKLLTPPGPGGLVLRICQLLRVNLFRLEQEDKDKGSSPHFGSCGWFAAQVKTVHMEGSDSRKY